MVGGFTDQEGAQRRAALCSSDATTVSGSSTAAALAPALPRPSLATCEHASRRSSSPRVRSIHHPEGRSPGWGTGSNRLSVCEATFIEQTNAGMLRAPAFQGIKTGIKPRDVTVIAT